ncbi:MAG: VWA domain-containing protein [Chloroflexota bacterium]
MNMNVCKRDNASRIRWLATICMTLFISALTLSSAQADGPDSVAARSRVNANNTVINEGFENNALPSGWQSIANVGTTQWRFDDPENRSNLTTGDGNFAIIDSDHAGNIDVDAELRTPTLDMSSASKVRLTFKTRFRQYQSSKADVDISTDGGQNWDTVWSSNTDVQGVVNVDLTQQAAGQSNVVISFRYSNANYEWYWLIDDVKIEAIGAPAAPNNLNAAADGSGQITLNWADNSNNESAFEIERSTSSDSGFSKISTVAKDTTSFTNKQGVSCATTYYYRVRAVNGASQSNYTSVANATTGTCATASGALEQFNSNALPNDWSAPFVGWQFNDPQGYGSYLGIPSGFASVENMKDAELRTPVMNFSGQSGVNLSFETFNYFYASGGAANVDVSADGGQTWVNVWRKTGNYNYVPMRNQSVDISRHAAGKSNVIVRFDVRFGSGLWIIDNVNISGLAVPNAPANLSATLGKDNAVNLAWSGSRATFEVERSTSENSGFSKIGSVTNGASTYVDKTAVGNTTYYYRVRSVNATGNSGYSNVANVTTAGTSIINHDITVSLYHSNSAFQSNQTAILDNIRYFADAVYEMSNGTHRLGRVTFYTNGNYRNKADIIWVRNCHPNAYISGRARASGPYKRIEHCDNFSGSNFVGDTDGRKSGGYTLAHEWGHYFYSLYDEYVGSSACSSDLGSPCNTDRGVQNSVMNSQWKAVSGDFRWLNFSTPLVNNSSSNAQYRVYGADAWTTLARPISQDPRNGRRSNLVQRLYYPELEPVAPASGQEPTLELDQAGGQTTARAGLQFFQAQAGAASQARLTNQSVNATSGIVRQIVIDRSAQMSADQLDDIKNVIQTLVDQAHIGDSIGIVAYDSVATQIQPIITIGSDADKQTIKSAIAGIVHSANDPAPTTGLQTALDNLEGNAPNSLKRAVYLITNGHHETGDHPFTILDDYLDAYVNVYTFGYSAEIGDTDWLEVLADQTDGHYEFADTRQELQSALEQASKDSAPIPTVYVTIGGDEIDPDDTVESSFYIDSTLAGLELTVSYLNPLTAATFILTDPDGVTHTFPTTSMSGTMIIAPECEEWDDSDFGIETLCYLALDDVVSGTWTLEASAYDDAVDLLYWVDGVPVEGLVPFVATVETPDGDSVTYPNPMVLYASVGGTTPLDGSATEGSNLPITGMDIDAFVVAPDGSVFTTTLRDDGIAPDSRAQDGDYAGLVNYTADGDYEIHIAFSNYSGNAKYTNLAVFPGPQAAPDPDGHLPDRYIEPVGENFERYVEYQVTVEGWQEDDHIDDIADEDGEATELPLDNSNVAGRIDFADDVDTFKVSIPADYEGEMVIRVADLGLGMDPYVYLFAEDFSWEFDDYLDTEPTGDDFLSIPLTVGSDETIQPGTTFFIQVYHFDELAEEGIYNISAGTALYRDKAASSSVVSESAKSDNTVYLPVLLK